MRKSFAARSISFHTDLSRAPTSAMPERLTPYSRRASGVTIQKDAPPVPAPAALSKYARNHSACERPAKPSGVIPNSPKTSGLRIDNAAA